MVSTTCGFGRYQQVCCHHLTNSTSVQLHRSRHLIFQHFSPQSHIACSNLKLTIAAHKISKILLILYDDFRYRHKCLVDRLLSILEALRLAKIPENIVNAVKALISKWSTQLNLPTENSNIDAGEIRYNKGVLQSDFLSVVLFILSLNPGSFLINKTTGYKIGPEEDRRKSLTHLLFVDDMKTFSSSVNGAKFQLDIITTFSTDIGMKFGEDKCGYIYIERGKRKSLGKSLVINGVTIRELSEGETYKYLGVEESIGYDGPLIRKRLRLNITDELELSGTQNSMLRTKLLPTTVLPSQ